MTASRRQIEHRIHLTLPCWRDARAASNKFADPPGRLGFYLTNLPSAADRVSAGIEPFDDLVDEEAKKAAGWFPFLLTATDTALNQRSGTGEPHKAPEPKAALWIQV